MENFGPRDEKQEEERRRKRERLVILLTLALVIFLTGVMTYFSRLHKSVPISQNLLVFTLINVNVILILFLLFLITRNIVKLIFERRRGVLGSRLKTKLVVAFVGLSFVPGLILFFVSAGFIAGSIESWFSAQVGRSLEDSLKLANVYYEEAAGDARQVGQDLAQVIAERNFVKQKDLTGLELLVQQKMKEFDLEAAELFSPRKKRLLTSLRPDFPREKFVRSSPRLVEEALGGKEVQTVETAEDGVLVKVAIPVYSITQPGQVLGVLVMNQHVTGSVARKTAQIRRTLEDYRQFNILKNPIKWSYLITLLLVTLLVIFAATWFGLYLARTITNPIQKLAEGTRKVAEGDLDFQADVTSDDEIGYLVDSFNKMTRDLKASKTLVERAGEEVRLSNLELESRRKNMEIILRNIAAGVISLNASGRITTVNKSAEEMLAIKSMRILGKNYREILSPQQMLLVRGLVRDLNHSKEGYIRQQVRLPLPGRTLHLLVSLTTLRDDDGQYQGMVVVLDDLSPFVKAQRMAAWREVARRIAHEIKNPLTPIQLSAQRLRKKFAEKLAEDSSVFDECTNTIIKQVDELKGLVNEFSRFARMPQINPAPADINQVIEEAMVLFKEGHRNIKFHFEADSKMPPFDLDQEQMKRALINLLDNAVAAVDKGGEVRVTTQYDPAFQLVTLEICDNGHGLPPGDKARLFEPYFSTKEGGSGLGLAIVNSIIADHNGYVKIQDNEPRGTKVIIELPIRTV